MPAGTLVHLLKRLEVVWRARQRLWRLLSREQRFMLQRHLTGTGEKDVLKNGTIGR
jgi:hypothetical protein